jgi:hypothetical protein
VDQLHAAIAYQDEDKLDNELFNDEKLLNDANELLGNEEDMDDVSLYKMNRASLN